MPWIAAAAVVGSALISSRASSRAADAQADAAQQASDAEVQAARESIEYQRETRDLIRKDNEPLLKARNVALDAMMSMTGLPSVQGFGSQPDGLAFNPKYLPLVQEWARYAKNIGGGDSTRSSYQHGGLQGGRGGVGGLGPRSMSAASAPHSYRPTTSPLTGRVPRKSGGELTPDEVYAVSEDGKTEIILDDEGNPVAKVTGPSILEPLSDGTVVPHPDNVVGRKRGGDIRHKGPRGYRKGGGFTPPPGKDHIRLMLDLDQARRGARPRVRGYQHGGDFDFDQDALMDRLSRFLPNKPPRRQPAPPPKDFTFDPPRDFWQEQDTGRYYNGETYYTPPPRRFAPGSPWFMRNYDRPTENPGGQRGRYNFMMDPGYEFRLNEGAQALERSAAARGGLLSSGLARKMIRYAQGIGSDEYQRVYDRVSRIAGFGAQAGYNNNQYGYATGQGVAAALGQMGSAQASGYLGAGNAQASGYLGQASAINNTIGQLSQLYGYQGNNAPSGYLPPPNQAQDDYNNFFYGAPYD